MNMFLFVTLIFALAIPALAIEKSDSESEDGPFVHTVYFWLENPDSQPDHDELLEGLRMIEEIDLIDQAYVGVPAPTSREVIDSSYDFSITFIFENMEDEQAYQTHPTHLKFVENYSHLWKKVVVYDTIPPSE